ncbi:hypothetical protein Tco_0585107 [Tanacetum coccineum]
MASSSNRRGAAPDDTTMDNNGRNNVVYSLVQRDGHVRDERHNLVKEAKAEKERAIYDKELEEFLKAEQAHDELFRMEFRVKSDSEYETD